MVLILAPMALFDLGMTVVNIILFVYPLRKLLRDIEKTGGRAGGTSNLMIATAYKYTILTSVTTITTVIFLIVIIASGIEFPAGADLVLNTICIFLLCPYYPDNKYYSVYCKLCIRCCDKSNYSSVTKKMLEKTADSPADERTSNLEPTVTSQTLATATSTQMTGTNTQTNNTITSFHKNSIVGRQTVTEEQEYMQTPTKEEQEAMVSDFDEEQP